MATQQVNRAAPRRPRAYITPYATKIMHLRKPWVTLWWSVMFPGFGHLILGSYLKGFLLIIWEFSVNLQAKLNEAIILSFTGGFEQAKAVLDQRWLLLYIPVYLYAIWDTYRVTIDLNKYAFLANMQKPELIPFKIDLLEIQYLGKRPPCGALMWSALLPGLGHLYTHQLPVGVFILGAYVLSVYKANFLPAIHATMLGDFGRAAMLVDPDWLLFLPSLYGFSLTDSYVHTIECNKLFDEEQAMYLEQEYQHAEYKMPL